MSLRKMQTIWYPTKKCILMLIRESALYLVYQINGIKSKLRNSTKLN